MINFEMGFWQVVTMSIVEMMYNPRFTAIHSSPKERQLQLLLERSVLGITPLNCCTART